VDKSVLEDMPGKRELAPFLRALRRLRIPCPTLDIEKLKKEVIDSQIWRSVFRGGIWKDTPRDRAAHIIGNVWLHLHPSRRAPALSSGLIAGAWAGYPSLFISY